MLDGGVLWGADLASAVERCREVVDSDSKISVDVLITHTGKMEKEEKQYHTVGNYFRVRNIKEYYNGFAGVLKFMVEYPEVNFRHFAVPSKGIGPGPTRLIFEDFFTWPMQELGMADAKKDLEKPEGFNFAKLRGFLELSPEERLRTKVADYFAQQTE